MGNRCQESDMTARWRFSTALSDPSLGIDDRGRVAVDGQMRYKRDRGGMKSDVWVIWCNRASKRLKDRVAVPDVPGPVVQVQAGSSSPGVQSRRGSYQFPSTRVLRLTIDQREVRTVSALCMGKCLCAPGN